MIISASRRTDIPAYYSKWFIEALKKGWVDVVNPFNRNQISRVSLKNEDVDCFVFWTKNPKEFIPYLDILDKLGYKYYFQFTLNPYQINIEKNLSDKYKLIETFKNLSNKIGSGRVLWRYDPIIFTQELNLDYHLREFKSLSRELEGYTKRVTISLVEPYKKILKSLKVIGYRNYNLDEVDSLCSGLSEIANTRAMDIFSCSQKIDLEKNGIKKGACIDPVIIEEVLGIDRKFRKDSGQRGECCCIKSRDIGFYNSCKSGCIYCYANS